MRRVMDLPGWMPNVGGVGELFPASADQVTIGRVLKVMHDRVEFLGKFGARTVFCGFQMPDENTARAVAGILHDNIGKTLLSIGTIEVLADGE
jgi:hypothetical protein